MSFPPPAHISSMSSQSQAGPSTYVSSSQSAQYPSQSRPPIPPLERADMHALKQDLHDALGEHGLAYWKALNGYLLGQVGRGEVVDLVRTWLKGKKVLLHNRLLVSLLANASLPASSLARHGLSKKRKRVPYDHPDYDADETVIEPRDRVAHWAAGMSAAERARLRKAVIGKEDFEVDLSDEAANKRRRALFNSSMTQSMSTTSRHLPSSHQLAQRLALTAKAAGLSISPDATSEVGEFMAIGMDAHLSDTLHSIVHLTAKGRPGDETIRLPGPSNSDSDTIVNGHRLLNGFDDSFPGDQPCHPGGEHSRTADMPRPDLQTFQYLFELNPTLHPQESPTVYKLENSHSRLEAEMSQPRQSGRSDEPLATALFGSALNGSAAPGVLVPSTLTPVRNVAGRFGLGALKAEIVAKELLDNGLLKLDKMGRQGDGADGATEAPGKKDRKHNLHWKYEDPAIILKDILG